MKTLRQYIKLIEAAEQLKNPGRRGFLKKAGAVAATAAMPGSAMKALAPAAEPAAVSLATITPQILNRAMVTLQTLLQMSADSDFEDDMVDEKIIDMIESGGGDEFTPQQAAWLKRRLDPDDGSKSAKERLDYMWFKARIDYGDLIGAGPGREHQLQDDEYYFANDEFDSDGDFIDTGEYDDIDDEFNSYNDEESYNDVTTSDAMANNSIKQGAAYLARKAGDHIGAHAQNVIHQPEKDMGTIPSTGNVPTALPAPTHDADFDLDFIKRDMDKMLATNRVHK